MATNNSGFSAHRSRQVLPNEREDLERLAQYIIRNPFSVKKMQINQPGDSILYRSGMSEIALIDDRKVIERILRHLGLWAQGVRVSPSTGPPAHLPDARIIEPWLDDPSPDYDAEPVMAYAND